MSAIKNELIDKYTILVYEYLHIMSTSDVVKTIENQTKVIETGLTAVTHIYKLGFCISKNVATSLCHSQKGMYCYLEYIEQMNKSNMLHNLDNVDAVVFIYDKTLSEIYGSSSNGSTNTFTNILSMSESGKAHGYDVLRCNKALDLLSQMSATLVWFEHSLLTMADRMEIVEMYLHPLSNLFIDYSLDVLFPFIESVQEKIKDVSKSEYIDFIASFIKYIKRAIKQKQIPTKDTVNECCLLIHAHFNGKSIKQVGDEYGWKVPTDDLVKLLFS